MDQLVAGLAGAGFGALISAIILVWHERRRMKIDTLRRLYAARSNAVRPAFLEALNEVMIVYASHSEVVEAARTVIRHHTHEDQVTLIRAMASVVGIKHENLKDGDITAVAIGK